MAQAARALAACIPVKMLGAVRLDRDEPAVTVFEDSYFADLAPAQEEAVRQALRLVLEPGEGTT
ncbi:MerR family transcriptional regulator OS=Streptomyces rimosus subsp. rimosus (strain ATCC /DSM 40260 / JCM 4667 / NRRL 2234) OX=1265868 GN=SRIM_012050 PE=4 SV=1 [Streptomyces rimosus subsp. rimosus]